MEEFRHFFLEKIKDIKSDLKTQNLDARLTNLEATQCTNCNEHPSLNDCLLQTIHDGLEIQSLETTLSYLEKKVTNSLSY